MKQIFFIFSMMLTTVTMAQRSQEAFSITIKTSSEVRANNVLEALNKKIILTDEQKEELRDLIRIYFDEYQGVIERNDEGQALKNLEAYRDKMAKNILKNEEYFAEFLRSMEEVRRIQGNGYGRR